MRHTDVCIAGAGIIGLSLALELHRCGLTVAVLESDHAMGQASHAAAGMLAADDPENPPALSSLAQLSLSLYPEFLRSIESLSNCTIKLRTSETLQALPSGTVTAHTGNLTSAALALAEPHLLPGHWSWLSLPEHSLDPRELATSLLKAFQSVTVRNDNLGMHEHCQGLSVNMAPDGKFHVKWSTGQLFASRWVDCRGAWSGVAPAATSPDVLAKYEVTKSSTHPSPLAYGRPGLWLPVKPKKGQMLTVLLPPHISLRRTLRTLDIYLVPRGEGRVVIGATMEDVGFDTNTDSASIQHLLRLAAELVPAIAHATILEQWAGLRPGTPDGLPLLGAIPGLPGAFAATGHFRNGILLAPATARVMAQMICGEPTDVDLTPFNLDRFADYIY